MKPGTLTFKDASVKATDLVPELLEALGPVTRVFGSFNLATIVTSLNDAEHRKGSFHYSGRAVDLRSKHVPMDRKGDLFKALVTKLGADFDVILEDRGGPNEHFHIEFDPDPA